MTVVEIVDRLKSINEAQKTIEVQIQTTKDSLVESKAKEASCKEGVDVAKADLDKLKDSDVVSIAEFLQATDRVNRISNYHDQAESLRLSLEAHLQTLTTTKGAIQQEYDCTVAKFSVAERNLLKFQ